MAAQERAQVVPTEWRQQAEQAQVWAAQPAESPNVTAAARALPEQREKMARAQQVTSAPALRPLEFLKLPAVAALRSIPLVQQKQGLAVVRF